MNAIFRNSLSAAAIVWVIAFSSLIFITQPMLPMVMQDEFIYRNQVVHQAFADYGLPNYLFGLIARLAEATQENYYLAIKIFNAIVAATAASTIFVTLRRIIGTRLGVLAAAAFIVLPSFLQSSFYMPDMFLSAFLAMTICILSVGLSQERDLRDPLWLLAATTFVLAFLSKPHAIIALAGVLLVAGLHTLRKRALSPLFVVVVATLVGRLAIGWLFAGTAGLNLFGPTYTSGLFGSDRNLGASVASGPSGTTVFQGVDGNVSLSFLFEFGQLLTVFILWSFGLLLVLLLRAGKDVSSLFLSVVTLTSLFGVALFETIVGYLGDDHTGRVLTRHVEYLLPIVLAFGLAELRNIGFRSIRTIPVPVIAVATSLIGFFSLWSLPMTRASDGTFVELSSQWSQGFLAVLLGLTLVFWSSSIFASRNIPVLVAWVLVVASSVAGFNLRAQYSSATQVDFAGNELANQGILRNRDVLVISTSKTTAELMRFYLVPKSSSQRIFGVEGALDVTSLEGPEKVLIPVGEVQLFTSCPAVTGTHFVYYDCGDNR